MKIWKWYFLVIVDLVVLIMGFYTRKIYIALAALLIGLYLKKHYKNIPLPEQFRKYNIVSMKSEKVIKANKNYKMN